jgi:hypothetical protein
VAQEASASENPLAALNDELKEVLADASVPFTPSQESAVALMMEDRRRASEDLFGDLMNFRSGPTQGQDEDRLRSAIQWMRNEFIRSLGDFLTPEQNAVWQKHLASREAAGGGDVSSAGPPDQTQYVRINNNSFTAEDEDFGGGSFTEVIQRGGAGAWHGNAQLLLKDDALNARNPFAENEPPYQERRINVDVSGPTIPGRMTSSFGVRQNESKNADTVRATRPEGVFALGITRPHVFREVDTQHTYQVADAHSLRLSGWFGAENSDDQGVGGFTLPERGSDSTWNGWNINVRQFSALSTRSIFESRFEVGGSRGETIPQSEAVRINVLDAFNGGGAQNRGENRERSYNFGTLYTRLGETVTIKTGAEGWYRREENISTNNFGGTFTFSSLDAYLAGRPLNYRVNRGNPLLEVDQLQAAGFLQTDIELSSQLTLMLGTRYDIQTNLGDYNNLSPRVSLAYAPGEATVIRGGGGLFYNGLEMFMVENQRRFDGTRQFEIVIDDPSYPDPFASGTIRQTFPSVRVTDPDLRASEVVIGSISIERTFFSNLLLTASYDYQREYGRLRVRNLNAPLDITSPVPRSCTFEQPDDTCSRPDPTRGNVISLESSGNDIKQNVRFSARKRFSIFNASASYRLQRIVGDVQGSPGSAAMDNYDLQRDWGRSPTPRHEIEFEVNARLPLGIFLTGEMEYNSGRFYSITTGRDDNRDNNVNDRPPGVSPNSERGPRYLNFDFNISKAFFFRQSAGGNSGPNLNVFVNMTNAFNRVHYGTPSGVITSPNFGRSTSASNPREIEAGIRFQF